MPLFGRNDQAVTANSSTTVESTNGAPLGVYALVKGAKTGSITPVGANSRFGNTSAGSAANVDSLMFNNVTPNQFVNNQAVGVFGVSATEMANSGNSTSHDHPPHAGWVVRRAGVGPITGASISNNGANFANGETIAIGNGNPNATLTVVTNATGNMVSVTIGSGSGGLYINTSIIPTAPIFTREQHLANVQTTGTGLQYTNGAIVTVSNAAGVIVPAVVQLTTNATGGLANTGFALVNVGLFANSQTNAGVTFTVSNTTGNTSTTGFNARIIPSTNGNVNLYILGGRAGRVWTETLVAMGSLGAQSEVYGTPATANDSGTDDTYYPGI